MDRRKQYPKAASRWVAAAAVAAVWSILAPGGLQAQQAQTTLPEMNVTAPKNQPRPEWYTPRPGMLGKVRVEEDKWPVVPCATSRMDDPAAVGTCQAGPLVMNSQSYGGSGYLPQGFGSCTIAHPLITTTVGRLSVEADVLVFDPYKVSATPNNPQCTVWGGFQNLPGDFRDMNQVARRGLDWRDFVTGGGRPGAQSTMEFADAGRSCLALEKLGPQWKAGFIWVLHATLCGADAAAPTPIVQADIDAVLATLRIRIYDASGNLMPAPAN
jgi:hypothetical protein